MKTITIISLLFSLYPTTVKYKQLSWSDFKGKPTSTHAAETSTTITVSTTEGAGVFHYHVESWMSPYQSFTRTNNPYVLLHEQGHFDITEIYTRKAKVLAKRYDSCGADGNAEFQSAYSILLKAWGDEQQLYDMETSHSQNKEAQEKWGRYISERLQLYSKE